MTLAIYVGTAGEITDRLAGAPSGVTTTVASVTSVTSVTLASAGDFAQGDRVVIGRQKAEIEAIAGAVATLSEPLGYLPAPGDRVAHYNADYTSYRDKGNPFVFADDRKTGGGTGDITGQDLTFFDYDGLMADIPEQSRITIFDTTDPATPLFAGIITASERVLQTRTETTLYYRWLVEAKGYQWEADSVGIDEQPLTNINAGALLEYLRAKWTNLAVGEIDAVNSPTLDFVRLSNFRRFSDVGRDLSAVWPGSEFYIQNGHTGGAVYFRQAVSANAPILLSEDYQRRLGTRQDQYINIRRDYDKVYNVVMLPYYREQYREPDFHVQTTTVDEAFLKTSVTLAGQPASLEESLLAYDDFSDGALSDGWVEDDSSNPSPPDGYNSADGYLLEGALNQVPGFHLLDAGAALGDIGRQTDPGEGEPFTGAERQTLLTKEIVINALGDAVVGGIIDQTTRQTTAVSGSTTSRVYVASTTGFVVDDRVEINGDKPYITAIGAGYLDVSPSLTGAPDAGDTVSLHRLAKSRIVFGVAFKADGSLKYLRNGVEYDFDTPRVYSAGPSTYSLRLIMRAWETTITGGVSATGCTLDDASRFQTGDVVALYTGGSRTAPEWRTVTVAGSALVYSATDKTPAVGYRVRTAPKITLQIKGGSEFGDITGRDWTTIYEDAATLAQSVDDIGRGYGVLLAAQQSLTATISLVQLKNPIPITASIGARYLVIGGQEIDSAEADTDCIVRKVGSHFQLDFFPDTKALWASGETLELRYKERLRVHLEKKDTESMRELARVRGYTVGSGADEQTLVRLGGRMLDSLEILPTPVSDIEARNQSQTILEAISSPAVTVEIATNTHRDALCVAGQTLKSTMQGVPDLEIQRVEIREVPGVKNNAGASIYRQRILAGTVDRLSEILTKRILSSQSRLILDDGVTDDTFTRLQEIALTDKAVETGLFDVTGCDSPSRQVFDGVAYAGLRCLKIAG